KEVRVEAPPYCCSTCEGEEVACGNLARRRRKTRSLSTSSASSSSSEYRRTQSLHGPSPVTTFGPKACMLQVPQAVIQADTAPRRPLLTRQLLLLNPMFRRSCQTLEAPHVANILLGKVPTREEQSLQKQTCRVTREDSRGCADGGCMNSSSVKACGAVGGATARPRLHKSCRRSECRKFPATPRPRSGHRGYMCAAMKVNHLILQELPDNSYQSKTRSWHIQDPASQKLTWNTPPKSVLVIKKIQDASLLEPFKELCIFLAKVKNMIVYVEKKVLEDPAISSNENFGAITKGFCTFREDLDNISNLVDFIICLGGDGTLLYASSLFQESVPPVMAFHLGSLGFLTPFKFDTYQSQVTQVIEGNAPLSYASPEGPGSQREPGEEGQGGRAGRHLDQRGRGGQPEGGAVSGNGRRRSPHRSPEVPKGEPREPPRSCCCSEHPVLNEVVVDRGPSSYLSNVDLFLDGHLITTVQGDGLIVSTPTGSTAYAVAAGASMIHPNVPAIMIPPICPHSLSFRPIVVPAGVELKIMLSCDARNTAWVSFDGRKRQEICHGDSITITTSCFPVPSICFRDPVNDWFESLAQCLHWNVRKKQNYLSSEDE
ncbi:unnamed protein product, partial [Tetraodon nigroviridis]